MTFDEAKFHARHNMNSKHKFAIVTNDGQVYLTNDEEYASSIEGHLVKGELPEKEIKNKKDKE